MEVQLTEDQSSLLKDIAAREGFGEFELETTPGSSKGDNYLGIITRVTVKNHRKPLELILKSASPDEELRKKVPIRQAFLREIYLYDTIFPAFEEFQKEHSFSEGFSNYPKIYGSSGKELGEFLILENLKEQGYEMCDRRVPMNADHAKLVFAEYGKFHAISLAMREKKPELYAKLTEDMNLIYDFPLENEEVTKMVDAVMDNGFKAVKDNQAATEEFGKFSKVVIEFLQKDVKALEDRLVVLHGDVWCNNLLFKYDDPTKKKPSKICVIDWQVSMTGSPVLDLSHFLFANCPREILVDCETYLKIYYDNVCEVLRNLDCDPETTFPFSLLERHWIKYAKYGVYLSLFFVRVMLGDVGEVPNLDDMVDVGGFNFNISKQDSYNQRISDVITVAAEKGLF